MSYGKKYDWRQFTATINNQLYVFNCCSQDTNTGFRHLCYYHNELISKAVYYNRSWERFEYETVLRKAINKLNIPEAEKELLRLQIIERTSEQERIKSETIYNDFVKVWNETPPQTKEKFKDVQFYSLQQAEQFTKSLKILNIMKEGV